MYLDRAHKALQACIEALNIESSLILRRQYEDSPESAACAYVARSKQIERAAQSISQIMDNMRRADLP